MCLIGGVRSRDPVLSRIRVARRWFTIERMATTAGDLDYALAYYESESDARKGRTNVKRWLFVRHITSVTILAGSPRWDDYRAGRRVIDEASLAALLPHETLTFEVDSPEFHYFLRTERAVDLYMWVAGLSRLAGLPTSIEWPASCGPPPPFRAFSTTPPRGVGGADAGSGFRAALPAPVPTPLPAPVPAPASTYFPPPEPTAASTSRPMLDSTASSTASVGGGGGSLGSGIASAAGGAPSLASPGFAMASTATSTATATGGFASGPSTLQGAPSPATAFPAATPRAALSVAGVAHSHEHTRSADIPVREGFGRSREYGASATLDDDVGIGRRELRLASSASAPGTAGRPPSSSASARSAGTRHDSREGRATEGATATATASLVGEEEDGEAGVTFGSDGLRVRRAKQAEEVIEIDGDDAFAAGRTPAASLPERRPASGSGSDSVSAAAGRGLAPAATASSSSTAPTASSGTASAIGHAGATATGVTAAGETAVGGSVSRPPSGARSHASIESRSARGGRGSSLDHLFDDDDDNGDNDDNDRDVRGANGAGSRNRGASAAGVAAGRADRRPDSGRSGSVETAGSTGVGADGEDTPEDRIRRQNHVGHRGSSDPAIRTHPGQRTASVTPLVDASTGSSATPVVPGAIHVRAANTSSARESVGDGFDDPDDHVRASHGTTSMRGRLEVDTSVAPSGRGSGPRSAGSHAGSVGGDEGADDLSTGRSAAPAFTFGESGDLADASGKPSSFRRLDDHRIGVDGAWGREPIDGSRFAHLPVTPVAFSATTFSSTAFVPPIRIARAGSPASCLNLARVLFSPPLFRFAVLLRPDRSLGPGKPPVRGISSGGIGRPDGFHTGLTPRAEARSGGRSGDGKEEEEDGEGDAEPRARSIDSVEEIGASLRAGASANTGRPPVGMSASGRSGARITRLRGEERTGGGKNDDGDDNGDGNVAEDSDGSEDERPSRPSSGHQQHQQRHSPPPNPSHQEPVGPSRHIPPSPTVSVLSAPPSSHHTPLDSIATAHSASASSSSSSSASSSSAHRLGPIRPAGSAGPTRSSASAAAGGTAGAPLGALIRPRSSVASAVGGSTSGVGGASVSSRAVTLGGEDDRGGRSKGGGGATEGAPTDWDDWDDEPAEDDRSVARSRGLPAGTPELRGFAGDGPVGRPPRSGSAGVSHGADGGWGGVGTSRSGTAGLGSARGSLDSRPGSMDGRRSDGYPRGTSSVGGGSGVFDEFSAAVGVVGGSVSATDGRVGSVVPRSVGSRGSARSGDSIPTHQMRAQPGVHADPDFLEADWDS